MANAFVKYFLSLFIMSAFFSGVTSEDVFFHLGCYASIIFGFTLRMVHIARKTDLTRKIVLMHAVATVCICWLAFIVWQAKIAPKYPEWYMVYLFCSSFFAVVISNTIDQLGRTTFREWKTRLARKLLLDEDKEDET